jgi:signal transduction histidine kinase/DNA-binding NarL/FixJ family response regulator
VGKFTQLKKGTNMKRIKHLLNQITNVPSPDPDDARRKRLLNIILVGFFGIVSLFLAYIILLYFATGNLYSFSRGNSMFMYCAIVLAGTALIYLWGRVNTQMAGFVFISFLVLALFLGGELENVINGQDVIFFAVPIGMASILSPFLGFVVAVFVSLIHACLALFVLHNTGLEMTLYLAYLAISFVAWLSANALEETVKQLRLANTELNVVNAILSDERNSLEERVQERTAQLEEARSRADAASHAKSTFLANMSHELRTPLNGILGYVQILGRRADLDEQVKHGLNVIRQSGDHLLMLINDVLDLAKIEAGRLELNPAPANLPSFLDGVCGIMRSRADQKGVKFNSLAGTLPLIVQIDEKRLRQVLLNLIGNAIKFTDTGGRVTLRVTSSGRVEGGTAVCFDITDSGIGMTPEQMARLFRTFEQVSDDRRYRAQGTGLGLALSQQLVGQMGGVIEVQSKPGEGSRFWFTIALPNAQNDEPILASDPIGYTGPRRKLLVVDDRVENRMVLRGLLEELGFEVLDTDDGRQAIAMANEQCPDVIFMDLVMPGMNGFDAVREIRANPDTRSVVIFAVSASAFTEERTQSVEIGCNGFLTKPVILSSLVSLLENHLPDFAWIYPQANPKKEPRRDTRIEEVGLPAPEILASIRALLDAGDLGGIEALAEKLAQESQTESFAALLKKQAQTFDEMGIRRILEEK